MTNLKTLVVLTGNPRGSEVAWNSMYTNLLDVYQADLALCFGASDTKNSSLYTKAKYIWEIPEYKNWIDFYTQYFDLNENWLKCFLHGKEFGFAGGIDNYNGSGAIVFAFRQYLKYNCADILKVYDRIILTRSDHFYATKHPILDNESIWIVEGEDYGGLCDRHHIFPSKYMNQMLGVLDYMNSDAGLNEILQYQHISPEKVLKLSFRFFNIDQYIKRHKRVQFTVATKNDQTRWMKASIPFPEYNDLYIKYIDEYTTTMANIKSLNNE